MVEEVGNSQGAAPETKDPSRLKAAAQAAGAAARVAGNVAVAVGTQVAVNKLTSAALPSLPNKGRDGQGRG